MSDEYKIYNSKVRYGIRRSILAALGQDNMFVMSRQLCSGIDEIMVTHWELVNAIFQFECRALSLKIEVSHILLSNLIPNE